MHAFARKGQRRKSSFPVKRVGTGEEERRRKEEKFASENSSTEEERIDVTERR